MAATEACHSSGWRGSRGGTNTTSGAATAGAGASACGSCAYARPETATRMAANHGLQDMGFGDCTRNSFRSAVRRVTRSEEHTSELQSLMRISYAVFCLKKQIKILNQFAITSLFTH